MKIPTTKTSRSHSARNFQELVTPSKAGSDLKERDKTNLLMKTAISNKKISTGGSVRSKKSNRSVNSRKSRKNSSTGVGRKTKSKASEQAATLKV